MTSISIRLTDCILNNSTGSQFQVDLSHYVRRQTPVRFFREPTCEIRAPNSAFNLIKELYTQTLALPQDTLIVWTSSVYVVFALFFLRKLSEN